MKKHILYLTLFSISFMGQAQIKSKQALGLRLGGSNGLGYEISYQRALNDVNRWQFDLGARSNDEVNIFKLSGTYQWVNNLSDLALGFNWFYGAGGGIGAKDSDRSSETFINILGNVGVEYNFEFPLQVTFGIRPEFGIVNGDNLSTDLAIGIRYRFE